MAHVPGCLQIYCIVPLVLYVAERMWRLLRNLAFKVMLECMEMSPPSQCNTYTLQTRHFLQAPARCLLRE